VREGAGGCGGQGSWWVCCRSGYFTFDSEMLDHGIKLYKFVLPKEELLNTTQKDYGFPYDNPSGVLDLTLNFDPRVPMFASKPHFLDADPVFLTNVTGLCPNASIHDSYMGVEPITGWQSNGGISGCGSRDGAYHRLA